MLFIIEGPDGGGKSHLANGILEALTAANFDDKVEVWHAGPPSHHPLDEYERPLFEYRPGNDHHIICDRWHIGEWIYPGVFQRKTQADLAVWRHIDLFLQSRGAVVIHTAPPLPELQRRVRERGDDLVSEAQLKGIVAAYRAMLQTTKLPVYRFTNYNDKRAITEIITLARYHEALATRLNPFITYIGPTMPEFLILGDVRHEFRGYVDRIDRLATIPGGPAFGPHRATSGHFLLSHLPYKLHGRYGLANACDVDDTDALRAALGEPTTIALGNNAWKCAENSVVAAAPHPQYVRRFFHHAGAQYGEIIANALECERFELGWRP